MCLNICYLYLLNSKLETNINNNFDLKSALMKSLVYMIMNWKFRSKNRLCELVIFDFMNQYCESIIARLKCF